MTGGLSQVTIVFFSYQWLLLRLNISFVFCFVILDTRLADISFSMILVGIISIILSIVNLIGMCKQHVSKKCNFFLVEHIRLPSFNWPFFLFSCLLFCMKVGRRILITHYLCVLLSVFFELYSLSWIMHSSSNLSRGIGLSTILVWLLKFVNELIFLIQ